MSEQQGIRQRVRGLATALLPPVALAAARQGYGWLRFRFDPQRVLAQSNRVLHSTAGGRHAFLIATGPSLKLEDLRSLAGEDCFSISNFFLHPALTEVRPRMHFFVPWHPPLDRANYIEWMRQAHTHLPPETAIGLGHAAAAMVREHGLFAGRRLHYFYLSTSYWPGRIDLGGPIPAPTSGPLMVLPVLLAMGYSRIYLLGCDHTVMRDFGGTITHFYETGRDIRRNASDAGAWADVIESHRRSLVMFEQYRDYARLNQRRYQAQIVNLSRDSWLDMFPRDTLPQVLGQADS